ncbi:MAG: RNA methyltransferase [Candidatus Thorarchaeota archaeon]
MNKKKLKSGLDSYLPTHRVDEYQNLTFTVVLVRPEHAGNIGSIARVMENFEFKKLILFNPIESRKNIFSHETQGFAMHGKEILMNAEIVNVGEQENYSNKFKNFLNDFDLVIATTAKGERKSNIRRIPLFPEDLSIPVSIKPLNIAILFGRESRGLTNEEINLTDIILRIPTGQNYSALNLSHACSIILYEIFKKVNDVKIGRGEHPVLLADREDRQLLQKIIKNIIKKLKIRTHKKENVFYAFRNLLERAFLSKKELSLIMGVFSKVEKILEGLNLYES